MASRVAQPARLAYPARMLRLFASLLIALGLVLAPAMMASAGAAMPMDHGATAMAADHCKGAAPAKQDGKADVKPCCSTACPMNAAIPTSYVEPSQPRETLHALAFYPVFAGLDPERETPPPRFTPAI